ncbi:MAG TPA: AAA family ATPase [Acidimicrobiales bacterium]|nr:AAA family ATPase [Acidimicrobiales bacterium]
MPSVLCPVLVGRSREMEELGAAVDAVAEERRGSTLFLLGDAGVGKSRLAREALDLARRRRFTVLWGRATPSASQVAFRPLAEALLSQFRDVAPPDSAELDPFRPILGRLVPEWRTDSTERVDESVVLLAEAVLRVLRVLGRQHGCLLVLEDLHWADPDTMAIVEYLADNLASEPVVCLGTLRPQGPGAGPAVADSLIARRAAGEVQLTALARPEVAAMARACLGLASLPAEFEAILEQSADGLPFLVEELLAGAVGAGAVVRAGGGWSVEPSFEPAVPRTFVATVVERLGALGPSAGVVLGAAAVLGRRFDWTILPTVTELGEREVLAVLGQATTAQLLACEQRGAGSFRFRHALTRDAVLGQLVPAERALLAGRALAAVERAHPELEGDWCELAAHLADQGGDRDRAAALLFQAGRRSLASGALATAEVTLERALAMVRGGEELALDIQEALFETLSSAGKADRALEVGGALVARLRPPVAPAERVCRVHLRLARTAAAACRWEEADAHLARVMALAGSDQSLTARAGAIGASVLLGRGDHEHAAEGARAALAAAERAGLHEVACEALEMVGRAARVGDMDGAERAFVQAHHIALEHGLTLWRVRALFELGTLDVLALRDLDRLAAARELALATGALAVAAHVDLHLAGWHAMRLDGGQVVDAARRAADTARRFGMHQLLAIALVFEADGLARLGRRAESEARLQEAFSLRGDDPELCAMAWAHVRARCSLIAENRRRAVQELDTAMDYFRRLSTAPAVVGKAYWALLRAVEDRDGEAACAEVRASGAAVNGLIDAYLRLADAVLLGRAGDRAGAEEAFASGDAALAAIAWHRQFGRRLVADAAIADGWGDPAGWMQEALPVFEDFGHDDIAAACRSLLRRAGAPVPRRGSAPAIATGLRSLGVTAREAEVLALLAEGLPNREIAERLYLSPRTVERHVSNLTTKAGVRGRSELIAFAARAT